MSPCKPGSFTMLAMVVALAAVIYHPAFVPHGPITYPGVQQADLAGRSQRLRALRTKNATPPATPVQSKDAKHLGAGKLLVASRKLADPNFAQTVVLLVHYDAEAVGGLILNRRTNLPLSRVLEGIEAAKHRSDRAYFGGPVETPAISALFRSSARLEGAEHIVGEVYLISSKTVFEQTIAAQPDPGVIRVYLGYAAWTNRQLRRELAAGSWFIFPADTKTVFDSDPDSLWSRMIRKTEQKWAGSEPQPLSVGKKHLAQQWMSEPPKAHL